MSPTGPTASQAARAAMLSQSYTPVTGAPVCVNCRHRKINQHTFERVHICGLGAFRINNAGTCELHESPETPS